MRKPSLYLSLLALTVAAGCSRTSADDAAPTDGGGGFGVPDLGLAPGDAAPAPAWRRIDVTDCLPSGTLNRGLWAGPWDGQQHRTLAPDTNTAYWVALLPLLDAKTYGAAHFELEGVFPDARYLSFHLYSDKGVYQSHLRDTSLVAAPGSQNPMLTGHPLPPEGKRRYRVAIVDHGKLSLPGENVLPGGKVASGEAIAHHQLMLRYYDPARAPGQAPGLVAEPRVLLVYPEGATEPALPATQAEACKLIDPSWYGKLSDTLADYQKAVDRVPLLQAQAGVLKVPGYEPASLAEFDTPHWIAGAHMACTFKHIFPTGPSPIAFGEAPASCDTSTTSGAFNFDQRYLFAFLDPTRAPATVMRFRAPSAARRGDPMLSGPHQVRYWSICAVQTENQMYTYGCVRDDEFVRDAEKPDWITLVLTRLEDRPAWACEVLKGQRTGCKANWIPYTSPINWLYLRQLAPAESFQQSTMKYTGAHDDSAALQKHLGDYYPVGAYCGLAQLNLNLCGLK